ncbi:MAG: hypothetical protein IPQ03_07330 [Bacteroidetes bacterium]|nr:hypothetical protein [Bacteroidota bacterium]
MIHSISKEGIAFLRQRLIIISTETTGLKKENLYKQELKQTLDLRIATLNKVNAEAKLPVQKQCKTIVVMVYARLHTAEVSVSFFVQQAAWLPFL